MSTEQVESMDNIRNNTKICHRTPLEGVAICSLVIDGQFYDYEDGCWELDRMINLYRYPDEYANFDGEEDSKLLEVARRVARKEEKSKLDKLVKGYKTAAEDDDEEKMEKLTAEINRLIDQITSPKGLSLGDKITLLSALEDNLRYLYHQNDNTDVKVVYVSK